MQHYQGMQMILLMVFSEARKTGGIYPNPATDGLVNVQLQNTNSNDVTVSVVNQIGQEVYNTTVKSGIQKVQLNTENLTPGIYFVKINNGSSTDSKKLIKY